MYWLVVHLFGIQVLTKVHIFVLKVWNSCHEYPHEMILFGIHGWQHNFKMCPCVNPHVGLCITYWFILANITFHTYPKFIKSVQVDMFLRCHYCNLRLLHDHIFTNLLKHKSKPTLEGVHVIFHGGCNLEVLKKYQ